VVEEMRPMGTVSRLTARLRGLFTRSRTARNDSSPEHPSHDLGDIVHERARREADLRRGGDSGGNTSNSSSYF
jgi:hypothetical protein